LSKVQVDTIDTRSGTSTMQIGSTNTSTINIGVSGDTVNIPSGVTIANAGTATGFGVGGTQAFCVCNTGSQTISTGTWTKVTFNSEIFDNGSNFASDKYTVPVTGQYHFTWGGQFDDTGSNGFYVRWILRINGSDTSQQAQNSSGGAIAYSYDNYEDGIMASTPLTLSASDYVELYIIHNSGSDGTLYDDTFFSGFRIA